MLKFIKHNMETIAGIELFPIISLLIFFTFFSGLLIWVLKTKKAYINHVENLPLED
ncbi:MAG: CcoQ/FixQ family Cbb3-type cytochrome c oxidase assembly chaperone [Bacteroidetes bacterium HGW-Bacteroidetes-12]|nr:MAG: CcoQ/FixQ family Cbb3-type cytochrome c oxidase assembly chaperone [Bacteroidetes bacterium HGW-Bacteroidetes-12]